MTAWLDIAAARGVDTTEALSHLEGAVRGNARALTAMGMRNPSLIYSAWASAAGVAASELTEAQKAQALMDAVLNEGAKVRGEYGKWLDSAPGRQQAAAKAADDLGKTYGRVFSEIRSGFVAATTAAATWVVENEGLQTTARVTGGLLSQLWRQLKDLNTAGKEATGPAAWPAQMRDRLYELTLSLIPAARQLRDFASAYDEMLQRHAGFTRQLEETTGSFGKAQTDAALAVLEQVRAVKMEELAQAQAALEGAAGGGGRDSRLAREGAEERIRVLTDELNVVRQSIAAYEARRAVIAATPADPVTGGARVGPPVTQLALRDPGRIASMGTASVARNPTPLDSSRFTDPRMFTGQMRENWTRIMDQQEAIKGIARRNEQAANVAGVMLGESLATGFGEAIGAGFEALGRDGLAGGLKALTGALVGGLGGAIRQFGMASLAASALMKKLLAAFSTLNPVASTAAAIGLIALGSTLQGAAQRAFSGGGGSMGGGGSYSSSALTDTSSQISIGTPAPARAPAFGTMGASTTRAPASIAGAYLPRAVAPVTVTGNIFASPYDPTWEANIAATVKQAQSNGSL